MFKPAGQVNRGERLVTSKYGSVIEVEVVRVKRYRLPQDPHKTLRCIIDLDNGDQRRCGENFMLEVVT